MLWQSSAVFLVLALLIATLWFLRQKGLATLSLAVTNRLSRHKSMQVLERVPLTAHHSLHLVRVQDRVILVAVSPSGCAQFDSYPAPIDSEEAQT